VGQAEVHPVAAADAPLRRRRPRFFTALRAPNFSSPFALQAGSSVQGLASAPKSYLLYAAVAGGIDAFTVDSATGVPTAIPGSPFASGDNPQLVVDPSGKFLYASDDDPPGGILAFTIDSSGALTPVQGSPFTIPGQTVANSVLFGIVDTSAFVYAALTATNQIAAFSIDSATGALAPVAGSPFSDERNPAALALADKFLYAVNEADGSISGYSISSSSGGLIQIPGSPFVSDSAALAADPSGEYLYNSTYEGILDFDINPDTGERTLGVASLSNDGSLWLTIVQLPFINRAVGGRYRLQKTFAGTEKFAAGLTLADNPCYSGEWFCIRRIEVALTVIQSLDFSSLTLPSRQEWRLCYYHRR